MTTPFPAAAVKVPVNPVLVCGSPHLMRILTKRACDVTKVPLDRLVPYMLTVTRRPSGEEYKDIFVYIGDLPADKVDEIKRTLTEAFTPTGVVFEFSSEPPATPWVFEALPKDVADVFANLHDPHEVFPSCSFGGVACAMSVPIMKLREVQEGHREIMRAFFNTPERQGRSIIMGVSYFVRDAIWQEFGHAPHPSMIGKWLGLDVDVHLFVPGSPRSDAPATFYHNGSMYGTQLVMMVTKPWNGVAVCGGEAE